VTDGSPAARPFRQRWAEVKAPLGRAALCLWLPALLAFPCTPLGECSHCVGTFLLLLPVYPGFLAGAWSGNGPRFVGIAAITTLALLALVATLFGVAARRWPWLALPVVLASSAQAIALGNLLRM